MITKDGSHSFHRDLWVSYLTHVQGGLGGEIKMMKIKSNKVSIVRAHSQGSFLLVNPPIPISSLTLVVLESLQLLFMYDCFA